jgi:predicted phosphoribosyltransferase
VLNEDVVHTLQIPAATIEAVASAEEAVLASREREYRGHAHGAAIRDRTVVLVDDGLATGASMRAAILALRLLKPRAIIVAVPVAPADTCAALEHEADRVVCLSTPAEFHGVGQWYEDFSQTTDDEVRALLTRSQSQHAQRRGLRLARGQRQP